jgi:2-C-methyl-D-erythritol 4-phosphate cytidylyltransferase/2-C-methyl-D-erythritol 2,4-cyclodiphosphate synthase
VTGTVAGGRSQAVAILLAAGSGTRLGGDRPKAFLTVDGRALLTLAAEAACAASTIASLVVAVPAGWERRAEALIPSGPPVAVVAGGETRQASVRAALRAVGESVSTVVCHDAARALCSPELFDRVVDALRGDAAGAVPVVPIPDTVKRTEDGWVIETLSRNELVLVQTPQAFRRDTLADAHERAAAAGLDFTDDAALVEWAGSRVRTVPGDPENIKVTTAADLALAAAILAARPDGTVERPTAGRSQ